MLRIVYDTISSIFGGGVIRLGMVGNGSDGSACAKAAPGFDLSGAEGVFMPWRDLSASR